MCTHGLPKRHKQTILLLTVNDRYERVRYGFDLIKLRKLTIHIMMVISDAIGSRKPTVFVLHEAQRNKLLDAVKLLPAMLIGSSYVDCVEFMF